MIKQHKLLFETLLELFKRNSEHWFFCNVNEDFEKLWRYDDLFKQEMLEKALEFTKEFYPKKYELQKQSGTMECEAMFQYNCDDNKIRIEFLNWLILQL